MKANEKPWKIINGNSLVVLDTLEENSIDSIVTDPPYELGFMGKKWDNTGIAYNVDLWKKAMRVLKPGGILLAFGSSRTFHRLACAIEDAGFKIRDTIMWLYGSGFPKSMNIGLAIDKKNGVESEILGEKYSVPHHRDLYNVGIDASHERLISFNKKARNEWNGWGTALKPSFEPIVVARKPFKGSLIENIEKYGVGGINIDECRVGNEHFEIKDGEYDNNENKRCFGNVKRTPKEYEGRFPANVILTYDETDFDEVCGNMPETASTESEPDYTFTNQDNPSHLYTNVRSGAHFGDSGNACRYFYCAKASKKDRDNGLIFFENVSGAKISNRKEGSKGLVMEGGKQNPYNGKYSPNNKNIHPTVKPVELMQYLIRLVTPKGGVILDIFNGSGSTGKAAMFENRERDANYQYIGIELDPEYCKISEARIDYALNKYQYDILEEIEENKEKGQLSLFDFAEENDDLQDDDDGATDK